MLNIRLKRKNLVRIVSFVTALIFALLGWVLTEKYVSKSYRISLQNHYASSMNDLSNYLTNINTILEKELYAGTTLQLSTLSAQLWKESGAAKVCLSQLPVSSQQTTDIYKFLSQVGDYSLTLSRKVGAGGKVTNEEREMLVNIKKYAQDLSNSLNDVNAMLSEGEYWNNEVKQAIENVDDDVALSHLNRSVQDVTKNVSSYPKLVYDGPFSDHILQREAMLLKGKATITKEKARTIAASYLECKVNEVVDNSEEDSAIAAYVFAKGDKIIAITKQGGYCLYMTNSRQTGSSIVTEEKAIKVAKDYLMAKYDLPFTESYYMINEGVCVVNFAFLNQNTICYSDLIKIGVALDNGEVVSVESRGFIMNHRDRTPGKAKYTPDQAKAVLSPLLTVNNVNMALINTGGLNEILCYEFVCVGEEDREILVYVNVDNLQEENILILLKTDGGIMTR